MSLSFSAILPPSSARAHQVSQDEGCSRLLPRPLPRWPLPGASPELPQRAPAEVPQRAGDCLRDGDLPAVLQEAGPGLQTAAGDHLRRGDQAAVPGRDRAELPGCPGQAVSDRPQACAGECTLYMLI